MTIRCKCGNIIHDILHPSDISGVIITELDWDATVVMDDLDDIVKSVIECSACGRINIDVNGDGNCVWYTPDTGKYEGVCKKEEA